MKIFYESHTHPTLMGQLQKPLQTTEWSRFPSGEYAAAYKRYMTSEAVILETFALPLHDHLAALLWALHSAHLAGAQEVTAIIPHMAYTRTAEATSWIASLLQTAGLTELITVRPHLPTFQTHWKIPTTCLSPLTLFAEDIQKRFPERDYAILSPDGGGSADAVALAHLLNAEAVGLTKTREAGGVYIPAPAALPDTRRYILLDDLIDTGTTLLKALDVVKEKSPKTEAHIYATHGLLSNPATRVHLTKAAASLTLTDTIPQPPEARVISIAPLIKDLL